MDQALTQVGRRRIPAFIVRSKPSSGCVVVLHEVWGLVPHIKDVCKRVGKLGFTALAPDLYWRHRELLVPDRIRAAMEGVWDLPLKERYDIARVKDAMGRKGLSDEILRVAATLYSVNFRDQMLHDAIDCAEYAHSKHGSVGSLGFCLGGGLSGKLATRFHKLDSCVIYYGEPPHPSDTPKITAPILTIHATHDELINAKIPDFVRAAIKSGKDLTLRVYPHTRHGFFNDTNAEVYSKNAAKEAWELTTWFLKRTLKEHRGH